MAKWHGISRRKATGGRLKRPNRYRGKRRTEISSETQYAFVGSEDTSKKYRKNAGSQTVRVTSAYTVNVHSKDGKTTRSTISNVIENEANLNFVRRNIVTKGAILQTELGKVKVTSRPGMDGVVSGILIEE
jgi:small subunit ribosomal protein S8e|tara:strand:+ start:500 stop:892 length:393 start_codon:yes stop_codon:yes gene_type:complete